MVNQPDTHHKLSDIWWVVLLRGLVELGFLIPLLFSVEAPLPLITLATVIIGVGGVLEVGMVIAMRGHFFQGILRFIGGASVALAIFMFFFAGEDTTPVFLQAMTGLWLVVRGFGVFWLGLSIIERPLDRTVPVLGGMIAVGVGIWVMFWSRERPGDYSLLMAAYAVASSVIHLFVTYRLWGDRRRPAGADVSVDEIEHAEEGSPAEERAERE